MAVKQRNYIGNLMIWAWSDLLRTSPVWTMHPDMQQKYIDQLKLFSNIFEASWEEGGGSTQVLIKRWERSVTKTAGVHWPEGADNHYKFHLSSPLTFQTCETNNNDSNQLGDIIKLLRYIHINNTDTDVFKRRHQIWKVLLEEEPFSQWTLRGN